MPEEVLWHAVHPYQTEKVICSNRTVSNNNGTIRLTVLLEYVDFSVKYILTSKVLQSVLHMIFSHGVQV